MVAAMSHPSLLPSLVAAGAAIAASLIGAYAVLAANRAKIAALEAKITTDKRMLELIATINRTSRENTESLKEFMRDYFRTPNAYPRRRIDDDG
jgi:cytochrome bd-type quinol oxidase subunit 1